MLYDYEVLDFQGQPVSLSRYKGKVLLIVNTATHCGFTPQYDDLQELYAQYRGRGFEILDFPCNQFGQQAPEEEEEINRFCTLNFGTTFPRFKKIDVNGPDESPLYHFLKAQKPGFFRKDISWNFTKFLVNREGVVVKRYGPQKKPLGLAKDIEKLL